MWFDEEITTVVLQLQEWVLFQALDYSEICHSGSCHASGHTIFYVVHMWRNNLYCTLKVDMISYIP